MWGASELGKCRALLGLLDAFRDRVEVQRLRKLHDRGDEPSALGVAGDVVDERLSILRMSIGSSASAA